MIAISGVVGRRFAVLGLSRTGTAAACCLAASGAEVWGWDDSAETRAAAAASGITLRDLRGLTDWRSVSCLIVSPGIPCLYPQPHPAVEAAARAGVPFDNDVGLFFSTLRQMKSAPETVAVTGSNGKSTTAALIDSLLRAAGRRSRLAGNIGRAVLAGDPAGADETVVLELSSYQTEIARVLEPDVAVFLNLSPDHLDRHAGRGGYFAAKSRLFGSPSTRIRVIGIDEPEGRFLASQTGCGQVVRISAKHDLSMFDDAVFAAQGRLTARSAGHSYAVRDLNAAHGLRGAHNHQNACAAFAACRALGLSAEEIAAGFDVFPGLPHRSQVVGEFNGILCVNDSKATNAESAGMALESFPRIRWIAGGLGKEGGIAPLAGRLGNVAKAYLVGRSAREFASQLGDVPHAVCGTIPRAVELACSEARPGDTLLLAPAAASFDQYPDFEARGDHFVSEALRCFSQT